MNPKNELILKTAQKLIFRHGFAKVTMTDVATACDISRPTLYKSYANMEAIIGGLIDLQIGTSRLATDGLINQKSSLKIKLQKFFEAWTLTPASVAIDSETGRDLLSNVANYAPEAVNKLYGEFEKHLAALLRTEFKKRRDLDADDLAHILALASRGLKASSKSFEELRRLSDGLVTLTVAAVSK